jgi:PLP dependent protein
MIAENYNRVLDSIQQAARAAGRQPEAVRLVVVTKGQSLAVLQQVIAAGARLLGENYVEEGLEKIAGLNNQPGVEWHMIGHIQSRKARAVCESFAYVHSLDSLKLAGRLERFSAETRSNSLPVLLQCNVSGEETKYGWPAWDESSWPALADELAPLLDYKHLQVRGLMTMAPYLDNPEGARPTFRRLRQLLEFLAVRLPALEMSELSMGMSGDYRPAIEEGSTLVRIGSAILGPREL